MSILSTYHQLRASLPTVTSADVAQAYQPPPATLAGRDVLNLTNADPTIAAQLLPSMSGGARRVSRVRTAKLSRAPPKKKAKKAK